MVGFAKDSALLQSITIGITLLISVMIGMSLIDKVGRKRLLLVGSVGMFFFLSMVAATFYTKAEGGFFTLFFSWVYCIFWNVCGTVIWVYIAEIFPNSVRAEGQTLGSLTHWAMAAMISWLFPVIVEGHAFGGGIAFTLFAVSMIFMFFTVLKVFPETKGKSLEEIQKEFIHNDSE